ncbi:HAD family hydrolase [Pontibacter saemangeumensis]|uniref:HAD family hydrolase n=1 Tax=Pontibacter saemangeumensis TaxID=1084525 RepID=UPI0031E807FB
MKNSRPGHFGGNAKELVEMVKETKPHPDVVPGFNRLRGVGFRMATLSNSPAKSSVPHLEAVGLMGFFEETLSVGSVERFKPEGSPYRFAAKQLGDLMITAHGWDVAGALRAGARCLYLPPGAGAVSSVPCTGIGGPHFAGAHREAGKDELTAYCRSRARRSHPLPVTTTSFRQIYCPSVSTLLTELFS